MELDFGGQAVLVTGGSGGIGAAICRRFAERGARVVVHYGQGRRRAEVVLEGLAGQGHELVQADLDDATAVRRMVDSAIERSGRLDVLVNNAGVFEEHPPLEVGFEAWQEQWRKTLGVNLLAAAHASYCAARHMAASGGGRIVNVTSRGAFRGEPESPAYGASKAGLNSLSQSLAKALAPVGVSVFAIAPGFVDTAMVEDHLSGEQGEAIRRQSPLERVASPDDVAYWVLSCAAAGAEFATGAIIDVNGASYLRS